MRFSLFAVSALTAAEAFAPTMNKPSQIIPPMMAQSRNEQHWWQPMAASIAALTLAGQVAVASVTMDGKNKLGASRKTRSGCSA